MQFVYEGASFDFRLSDRLQRGYALKAVKPIIGPLIGRPYLVDDYLALCYSKFGETPIAIDVGCNVGVTTLPLAVRYPKGTFIAAEAHPVALGELVQNLRLNRLNNVKVVSAAISPYNLPLRIYSCAQNSGGNRVTGFDGRDGAALCEEIIVPAMSLSDALCVTGITRADIIKIDTEGYELPVLKSLGGLLHPSSFPIVVAEYGPEGMRSAGTTGWALVRYMQDRGYRCTELHTGTLILTEADIPKLPDFSVTDFCFQG